MKKIKVILISVLFFVCGSSYAVLPLNDGSTVACSFAEDTEWVPSWGRVVVSEDQYSKYIIQYMYWSEPARLMWFWSNPDSTYEPEALFDGSGSGDLESGTSTTAYAYFPRDVSHNHGDFGYWDSNLPMAYQDTAWGDTGNEWDVTVGSAMAALINHEKVYYTITRAFDGGASSGEVKLQSQRGRRASPTTPWYVDEYGKWNSYSCSSSANVKTLPWYTFNAPGCHDWWYKWDITTNESCN